MRGVLLALLLVAATLAFACSVQHVTRTELRGPDLAFRLWSNSTHAVLHLRALRNAHFTVEILVDGGPFASAVGELPAGGERDIVLLGPEADMDLPAGLVSIRVPDSVFVTDKGVFEEITVGLVTRYRVRIYSLDLEGYVLECEREGDMRLDWRGLVAGALCLLAAAAAWFAKERGP